jgi:hypothetical protein
MTRSCVSDTDWAAFGRPHAHTHLGACMVLDWCARSTRLHDVESL